MSVSPTRRSRSASPRREPRRSSRSPAANSKDAIVDSTTLFVGNLPFNIREQELEDIFAKCGKTRHVKVGFNPRTGTSYGYGFVEYHDRRDAEEAFKKFDGHELYGRRLRLDWDMGMEKKRQMDSKGERRRPPRNDRDGGRGYGGYGGEGGGGYGGGSYAPYPQRGGYGGGGYGGGSYGGGGGYGGYGGPRERGYGGGGYGGYGGPRGGGGYGGRYSPYGGGYRRSPSPNGGGRNYSRRRGSRSPRRRSYSRSPSPQRKSKRSYDRSPSPRRSRAGSRSPNGSRSKSPSPRQGDNQANN